MGDLTLLQTLEGHTDRAWNVAWAPSGSFALKYLLALLMHDDFSAKWY